jgi:uncharacterized protein
MRSKHAMSWLARVGKTRFDGKRAGFSEFSIFKTALLFLAFTANPPLSYSAPAIDRKVTVSGECNLEVEPDRGSVILVADAQERDAKSAIRKATASHEELKKVLRKSKVKGLELSNVEYTVQEVTAWEDNKQVSKGFLCRIGLRAITSDIAALGEILSIAEDAGIQNTHSLETFLSDPKLLEEKKHCLGIAAKNAREKAEHLAKSLNAKLGPVQFIQERGGGEPRPPGPVPPRMFAMRGAESAPAPTIEAGKQVLHHDVEVTFSLVP